MIGLLNGTEFNGQSFGDAKAQSLLAQGQAVLRTRLRVDWNSRQGYPGPLVALFIDVWWWRRFELPTQHNYKHQSELCSAQHKAEHIQLLLVFSAHACLLSVRAVETREFSGTSRQNFRGIQRVENPAAGFTGK
jgi:hypothetical protein